MRFNLRQMEVFRAVMLAGTMSGAARLLNVSQPAVSRIVAYTEQSLGLRLFDRRGAKLTPTAEAHVLIAEVEQIYEGARQVNDLARDLAARPGGALTIAASPSLALTFIPAVIAQFLRAQPKVQVRYHTAFLADMAHELTSGKANLAISVLPVDDPGVICAPFATAEMVCLLPLGHPLAAQPDVSLRDLAAYPTVMYPRSIPFGKLIGKAFEEAGVEPQIALEAPRAELVIAMVRAGIGPAIVDAFAAAEPIAGVTRRHLREKIEISLSLLQPRFGLASGQGEKLFIDMLNAHRRRWRMEGMPDA